MTKAELQAITKMISDLVYDRLQSEEGVQGYIVSLGAAGDHGGVIGATVSAFVKGADEKAYVEAWRKAP